MVDGSINQTGRIIDSTTRGVGNALDKTIDGAVDITNFTARKGGDAVDSVLSGAERVLDVNQTAAKSRTESGWNKAKGGK